MDDKLKQPIEDYTELWKRKHEAHFKYLRNISFLAAGLLSLLVGLKPDSIQDGLPQYLFLSTISLIGLGILFSAVSQYYEVSFLHQNIESLHKYIKQAMSQQSVSNWKYKSLPKPVIYKISDRLTFGCLGLSIVTLIAYVFALELKF
jgi:sulfite exporter TauE/SafE